MRYVLPYGKWTWRLFVRGWWQMEDNYAAAMCYMLKASSILDTSSIDSIASVCFVVYEYEVFIFVPIFGPVSGCASAYKKKGEKEVKIQFGSFIIPLSPYVLSFLSRYIRRVLLILERSVRYRVCLFVVSVFVSLCRMHPSFVSEIN